MIDTYLNRLEYLISMIPPLLRNIDDDSFKAKANPDKWSKQEILGHLIDSAINNHQRFVRSQFENIPMISYNQNEWNKHNYYTKFDKAQLIEFWKTYNCQILKLMKVIPPEKLTKECNTGGSNNYSIEFLFNDYVEHLEHHLKQITSYK